MTLTVNNGDLTDFDVASDLAGSIHHPYTKVEFGADGTRTPVSTANPLPVVLTPAFSASSPLQVAAALATDRILNGTTVLTPKFFKANVAAATTDGSLIGSVAGKKIRVLSFRLHAGATATNVTFNSKPAGAGVAISELFALGANGGRAEPFSPLGHFETAAAEGLTVTTGSGSSVGIGGTYVEV